MFWENVTKVQEAVTWLLIRDSYRVMITHSYIVTNFIELSPSWEPASCAATQEVPNILWNPKINCFTRALPLVPMLSQINPVHTTPSYL
jgi:hypothetical protein